MYFLIASVAYALMVAGIFYRKKTKLHIPLMLTAMVTDVLLVLIIELQRDAIATVMDFKLGFFEQVHVGFSTLAVLLYVPMVYLGNKVRGGERGALLTWHRRLGWVTFFCRSVGFLFMFSMLE